MLEELEDPGLFLYTTSLLLDIAEMIYHMHCNVSQFELL